MNKLLLTIAVLWVMWFASTALNPSSQFMQTFGDVIFFVPLLLIVVLSVVLIVYTLRSTKTEGITLVKVLSFLVAVGSLIAIALETPVLLSAIALLFHGL